MPRPFSTSFSHAIVKPKQRTKRVHAGLHDPILQPGFGRGDHFRAGSMDAFACPSRVGSTLYYRSGEVKQDPIPPNPKPAYATY